MRKLALPSQDPGQVYQTCISKVRSKALKKSLESIKPTIVQEANAYIVKASAGQLYTLSPHATVGGIVDTDDMIKVYTGRMAKKGAPGREIYDKILLAPAHGTCPFCGHRKVSTVDHYLPKAEFPVFVVTPANLVPSCTDCNKAKGDQVPSTEDEQIIHPYFDDVDTETWLVAKVIEETPPGIKFLVNSPTNWPRSRAHRVQHQFDLFGLAQLYSSNAAEELENIKHTMTGLLNSVGANGVREHLMMLADSRKSARTNSWQAALYTALAENDWYCTGGFSMAVAQVQ